MSCLDSICIGCKCLDGVVVGCIPFNSEIMTSSRILEKSNNHMFHLDLGGQSKISSIITGVRSDIKQILEKIRDEINNYYSLFRKEISIETLTDKVSEYLHSKSVSKSSRPLSVQLILAEKTRKILYKIDNLGAYDNVFVAIIHPEFQSTELDELPSYFSLINKLYDVKWRMISCHEAELKIKEITKEFCENYDSQVSYPGIEISIFS
jgi:hypothetical protein